MSSALQTYLEDHLAGTVAGLSIIKELRDQHAGEPLGAYAAELLVEVEAERAQLQEVTEHVANGLNPLKNTAVWIGEKLSHLKLGRHVGEIGTFEALEVLSLGLLGKRALWRALMLVAPTDSRLQTLDLERLAARAQAQYDQIDKYRMEAARRAFLNPET